MPGNVDSASTLAATDRDAGEAIAADGIHLRTFLQRWMRDGMLRRLVGRWLEARVMEDGNVSCWDSLTTGHVRG